MIKFVPEDPEFGMMTWRLMSREVDEEGKPKRAIYVLPITGLGTYMRTVIVTPNGPVWEEPILLKNTMVLEIIVADQGSGLVDAQGQVPEGRYKCLNREMMTMDVAKKRFMPKGKNTNPGLELYPGALLTQEQRSAVQPAAAPPPELLKKMAEAQQQQVESQP